MLILKLVNLALIINKMGIHAVIILQNTSTKVSDFHRLFRLPFTFLHQTKFTWIYVLGFIKGKAVDDYLKLLFFTISHQHQRRILVHQFWRWLVLMLKVKEAAIMGCLFVAKLYLLDVQLVVAQSESLYGKFWQR